MSSFISESCRATVEALYTAMKKIKSGNGAMKETELSQEDGRQKPVECQ